MILSSELCQCFYGILLVKAGRSSSMCAWCAYGHGFEPHARQNILLLKFAHENVSMTILSLLLIQEGQLSVIGERMDTKYW